MRGRSWPIPGAGRGQEWSRNRGLHSGPPTTPLWSLCSRQSPLPRLLLGAHSWEHTQTPVHTPWSYAHTCALCLVFMGSFLLLGFGKAPSWCWPPVGNLTLFALFEMEFPAFFFSPSQTYTSSESNVNVSTSLIHFKSFFSSFPCKTFVTFKEPGVLLSLETVCKQGTPQPAPASWLETKHHRAPLPSLAGHWPRRRGPCGWAQDCSVPRAWTEAWPQPALAPWVMQTAREPRR